MIRGANRSLLLELRRDLAAAASGREVLEQKRELLLRELRRAVENCGTARVIAREKVTLARGRLRDARVAMGSFAVEAAILAQPESATVESRMTSIVGVPVPRLVLRAEAFRPRYSPPGALDEAGLAWSDALTALVALADAESVRRALRRGLARTARRLGALETIVIPRLRNEIRDVAAALDEEERDESLRRRRWLALRSHNTTPPHA